METKWLKIYTVSLYLSQYIFGKYLANDGAD